jgi:AcrR family transcriptional regulator
MRKRLLDAAENQIRQQGIAHLRARDVTQEAGCALGSLYNAFDDLDLLVLAVNARTIARLRAALLAAVASQDSALGQLEAMALAYVDFAIENPTLWAALFDHVMPAETPVPDWHIEEHAELIGVLIPPLAQIYPALDPGALAIRARTVFSAVHGIVKLSLERRFVALPPDVLRQETVAFVQRHFGNAP